MLWVVIVCIIACNDKEQVPENPIANFSVNPISGLTTDVFKLVSAFDYGTHVDTNGKETIATLFLNAGDDEDIACLQQLGPD